MIIVSFVLIRPLLVSSWVGAGHQKDKAMHDEKLGIFSPWNFLEMGEGLEMALIIDHAYAMKPP